MLDSPLAGHHRQPSDALPPHEQLRGLTCAGFVARCLHTVADLAVADGIEEEPVAVDELAARCAVDPGALDRVLRLLVAHGVFGVQDGGYVHTPASRLLRSDHPMSMRPFARMMGLPFIWGSLTQLQHAVRTGAPSAELLEPGGIWPYLQKHPDEAELFGHAMTAKAAADVAAVVQAYDFSAFTTVADIGGGRGHLLRAVLETAPGAEGVLFDLPDVVGLLNPVDPRLRVHGGDFFTDPLPQADAYVLMEILHDWPDERCVEILRAVRRAARDTSRLLVVEGILDEGLAEPRGRTLDLVMLTVTGGRERTSAEMAALFARGGFRLDRVLDTVSAMRVVEGHPV